MICQKCRFKLLMWFSVQWTCMWSSCRFWLYLVSSLENCVVVIVWLSFSKNKNIFCSGGKLFVSKKIYPHHFFPPFCHGGLSTLGFPILSDIYQMAKTTNRTGLQLEDVYITGILRSKLNRGHQNIKPLSYDGAKHKFDYHMGPFAWHLENMKHVDILWKIVFNMMNVSTSKWTCAGFWPSAGALRADVNGNVRIPVAGNDTETFFMENFGSVEYVNNWRFLTNDVSHFMSAILCLYWTYANLQTSAYTAGLVWSG